LGKSNGGQQSVKGTTVPGQAGAAQQLSGQPRPGRIDRLNFHAFENAVHGRISRAAPQHLGKRRGGCDDPAVGLTRILEEGAGNRVPARNLDQTFGIKNERASYS